MTNDLKQVAYASCRFVHHKAIFCQLFSIRSNCKTWSQSTRSNELVLW